MDGIVIMFGVVGFLICMVGMFIQREQFKKEGPKHRAWQIEQSSTYDMCFWLYQHLSEPKLEE